MDKDSLAHTAWDGKYHRVPAPEYRRFVLCGKIKADKEKIMRGFT